MASSVALIDVWHRPHEASLISQPELEDGVADVDAVAVAQALPFHRQRADERAGGGALVLDLVVLADSVDRRVARRDARILEQVDLALPRRSDPGGVAVEDELLSGDRTGQHADP